MSNRAVEWVTKTEVAERQLKAAIRMYFDELDPVAVHTVAAAGHQVLVDVGRLNGHESLLKPRAASRESIRLMNYPANFFKHADQDPEGRINVAPLTEFTAELLMDFALLFLRQTGNVPTEAKIYMAWFVGKNRELFEGADGLQWLIDLGGDVKDFSAARTLLKLHHVLGDESDDGQTAPE